MKSYCYTYGSEFSKKGWSSINALKSHLRINQARVNTWQNISRQVDAANIKLSSMMFYETDLHNLRVIRFTLQLDKDNKWVRKDD